MSIDAPTGSKNAAGGESEAQVRSATERLGHAIAENDRASLGRLLDAEFTFVDLAGNLHTGENAAAALSSSRMGAQSKSAIRTYGSLALVTRRTPGPEAESVAVEVWVNRSGDWHALVIQKNVIAVEGTAAAHPALTQRPPDAPPAECRNPCEFVPYEPKSQDERDLIASFQALEKAVTRNDADEWVKHVADEFIVYRTKQHPTTKAGRADALRRQKAVNAETFVAAIERMELRVHGDAAVMLADHQMPGNRRPPYRATRLWAKRDGIWQMAMSQQTTRASS